MARGNQGKGKPGRAPGRNPVKTKLLRALSEAFLRRSQLE